MKTVVAAGLLGACVLVGACKSDENRRVSGAATTEPYTQERDILRFLHQKNQEEIQAGRLAQARGSSEETRRYGARLEKDHTDSDVKLVALANSLGISVQSLEIERMPDGSAARPALSGQPGMPSTPPPQPPPPAPAQMPSAGAGPDPLAELRELNGPEFDRKFAEKMRQGHLEVIDRVDRAQNQVKEPRVKRFLADVLPVLRDHEYTAVKLDMNHP